jgi:hypothetical protein
MRAVGGRGAYAIRAVPDLCLGIVSGRLVSTRLLAGPYSPGTPGAFFVSLWIGNRTRRHARWSKDLFLARDGAGFDPGAFGSRVQELAARGCRRSAARRTALWGEGPRIRLPAKAKACNVCANSGFCISTFPRRCLHPHDLRSPLPLLFCCVAHDVPLSLAKGG